MTGKSTCQAIVHKNITYMCEMRVDWCSQCNKNETDARLKMNSFRIDFVPAAIKNIINCMLES